VRTALCPYAAVRKSRRGAWVMRGVMVLVVVLAAGCTADATTVSEPTPYANHGTFAPYAPGAMAMAVSYDPALVPEGATATVTITQAAPGTQIQLAVTGLRPDRAYGAHLHQNLCGAEASAAGPHYQHQPDPAASASPPSVDPAYANPENEVWLDFTTDASGAAASTAKQSWNFGAIRPGSLVIHAEKTNTAPGHAGDAGARVACLSLPR
jgi:Cu-Zn family superoxide dismutase